MPNENQVSGKIQIEKFREAAKELETDDDPERFDSLLKGIVKGSSSTPNPQEKPKKPAK